MMEADFYCGYWPGAGEHGGEVIALGTAEEIMKKEDSITGAYLSGRLKVPVPGERKGAQGLSSY